MAHTSGLRLGSQGSIPAAGKKLARTKNSQGSGYTSVRPTNNTTSKFWCFTINNPQPDFKDLDRLLNWVYLIAGEEICPETGTPHLQCFICYKVRTKFTTIKNQLPRAHIEQMGQYSTPEKAAAYCRKDGLSFEVGTIPDYKGGASGGKKKAVNYQGMIEAAKEGDMEGVREIDPGAYVRHYHAFKRIMQDNPVKVDDLEHPCGIWYYGPPGVGKSYKARKFYPDHYDKPLNKWWDGYRGEPSVILDDVDISHAQWIGGLLKRWADRYSFPAEQKGTTVQIRPKDIIVTSNYKIEEIFQDATLCKAIQRRFTEVEVTQWVPEPEEYAEFTGESEDEEDWTEVQVEETDCD